MKTKLLLLAATISLIYFNSCILFFIDTGDTTNNLTDSIFTDTRDGREYKIIEIGNQVWMAENLAYLPAIHKPEDLSVDEPRYYVYDFYGVNPSTAKIHINYETYGVLYNWEAATESCPAGWHLPSDAEWDELAEFIDNENEKLGKDDTGAWVISHYLNSTTGWKENSPPIEQLDKYYFKSLPAGYRPNYHNGDNYFSAQSEMCWFWSDTRKDEEHAYMRAISYYTRAFTRPDHNKDWLGVSVRCIKD